MLSREEPDISLSIVKSFILARSAHNISQRHGSALNTRNDFIRSIFNIGRHVSGNIASGVAVRVDSGVAGEGRVVGIPKFHSWGKCTMPLTNINSDWMSNASSGLCIIYIILYYIFILYYTSKVTAPQDAHGRLVLQVYLGSNTSLRL